VSYRDDVDALFYRAEVLQRELALAEKRVAEREAELAELRGEPRKRADTSPGIRELRTMPDPMEILSRLNHDSKNRTFGSHGEPRLPPVPMPDWGRIVASTASSPSDAEPPLPPRIPTTMPKPGSMIDRVREDVAKLDPHDLVLVAKIVEEFTDGKGNDELLRKRLLWLASELALKP
jgi:hypothetical protein